MLAAPLLLAKIDLFNTLEEQIGIFSIRIR